MRDEMVRQNNEKHPVAKAFMAGCLLVGGLALLVGGIAGSWSWLAFGTGASGLGCSWYFGMVRRVQCETIGSSTGRPCEHTGGGMLRGCEQHHRRVKHAAFLARLGVRYPPYWVSETEGDLPIRDRLPSFERMSMVLLFMAVAFMIAAVGFAFLDSNGLVDTQLED